MSQIITNAFSRYWQECLTNQTPVVLDEFVLANVPDLDPDAAINPDSGLPPAGQIVHRHKVDQRGRINNDAVAYTIVMDTTVGDFSFNAMYLINKASGVVGMIVHKGLETKLKTDEATGQTGNSLVKSMLMEYDRAAEATATHVDASTWQIDYAARLRGMDDDLRLQALQFFGPATFYGDGFKLVNESGVYKVQPGVAYVGGLRAELNEVKKITPGAKPVGLWVDIYRAGSLLDAWVNHFTLTLSVPDMVDYLDSNGYQHHVAKVAIINADGSVTDMRRKRTIELTGDVTGKGILEDAQGVTIAVEVKDGSHRHKWGELDQVPATASRWPSYAEVTDKPDLAAASHRHPWSQIDSVPATANRWPSWDEVTSKPALAPAVHGHEWSQVAAPARVAGGYGEIINSSYSQLFSQSGFFNNAGGFEAYGDPFGGGWCYVWNNCHENPARFCGTIAMEFGGKRLAYSAIEAGVGKGWAYVYSSANEPNYTHVHSAAQGNQDIVANGWGQVGTYALAGLFNSTGQLSPGALVAGSAINLCSAEGVLVGVAPSGTWKCLGYVKGDRNYGSWNVTLFIRVA
ncbi:phage tail protein [Aeromonas veronii]|uniref:phage tail-collar fiber domain-containing protein n=1 Tax=Aeromonas veronii TaxID=654 RepID=UPI0031FC975B